MHDMLGTCIGELAYKVSIRSVRSCWIEKPFGQWVISAWLQSVV